MASASPRQEPSLCLPAGALLDIAGPSLAAGTAYCVGLTIPWPQAAALREQALRVTLADEHERAARYLRPEDALRHLLGRALLRRLAATCGGADPRQPLSAGPQGKPRFEGASFDFSISHAADQVWVALARDAEVGIDVEAQQSLPDASEVVASFHPQEAAAIGASPWPERTALRVWTRKEAVAKATGLGLSLPLAGFLVDAREAASSGWLRVAPDGAGTAPWTTLDLRADAGSMAAMALRGRCHEVRVQHVNVAREAA